MGNLDIWNKLGKTDPAQTKEFRRGGGFKGTAIKPVYTEQKMTEQFGPCGTGWGFSEPTFKVEPGANGEVLVYCWLSLWYVVDGKRSDPVFGVGGDKLVSKFSSGLSSDDEAFKKAFTDAIGNAMKHLGMSADVHMGRFDDSKYVNDLRAEVSQASEQSKPASKADSRETYDRLSRANRALTSEAEFNKFWAQATVQDAVKTLPVDWKRILKSEKDDKSAELSERAAMAAQDDFPGDIPSEKDAA